MKAYCESFEVATFGKGTYEITEKVEAIVRKSGVQTGAVTVLIQHTSASLVIFENAAPSARIDLEAYFERLVPEGTNYFIHTAEGTDDSPSHIRTALTRASETIPVAQGKMQLGTWQGIFVFEHRSAPHRRRLAVSVLGV